MHLSQKHGCTKKFRNFCEIMSSNPKKRRRGRKPNSLKNLYDFPQEQSKRKDESERDSCFQKSKKRKAKTSSRKKAEKKGYEDEVKMIETTETNDSNCHITTLEEGSSNAVYCSAGPPCSKVMDIMGKMLQSSDISEMSLLSDFTMDYNQDPILMTNVETTVTVLDGNNPSEKIQLTPSQSEASLLVESPEACTVSISKHLYLSQTSPQIEYVSDEAAGEGDSSCMETTYLDCLLQSEQQTSNDQQMWPTFKEACQTRSASFSSLPDFNIDQSNSSIEFSEGYLKVAGLTNINLEELVDTASILLAVRDAENDETENICEAEKQARRKDFYKVMKGERRVKIHHCREPEKRLRGLVCCFDTDLIMKEIEFITDFIYCKYECPAVVQKFIQYNFWQNRLNCGKASMTAIHKFKKSRNNSRGTSLTHEVARCNTRLISAKRNNYIYSNPPVEEISRTVSHQHIRRTSLETNPHSLEPHPHSKKLHPLIDLRETLPKRTDNEEIEESLEVWKSNNENSFNSQDSCEWENWKSESSIDLFDRQFFNDDQPKDGVKQWLTLSEWWLSESLDVNEMLQLVDQQ